MKLDFFKKNYKAIITSVLIIGLFLVFSLIAREYSQVLKSSEMLTGFYGRLFYFLISIVDVVLAGISSSPLIPLAVAIWGPFWAFLLTTLGWTFGALLSFVLARKYGEPLICKFYDSCHFDEYRAKYTTKNIFWKMLLARIFLPVDIISYAAGMFTKMSLVSFFFSTLIGTGIFTFLVIIVFELPLEYQILFGATVAAFFIAGYKLNSINVKNKAKLRHEKNI